MRVFQDTNQSVMMLLLLQQTKLRVLLIGKQTANSIDKQVMFVAFAYLQNIFAAWQQVCDKCWKTKKSHR